MSIVIIAAMTHLRVIGDTKQNGMLWHDKNELEFFKSQTLGKKCIVGRKTAEQMPILKGRDVYVMTSKKTIPKPDIYQHWDDLPPFFHEANEDIMIIGGELVYKFFMPHADKAIISTMKNVDVSGDVYMPNFSGRWKQTQHIIYPTFNVDYFERGGE